MPNPAERCGENPLNFPDRVTGAKGKEYAQRFFCADWTGNRIEISL